MYSSCRKYGHWPITAQDPWGKGIKGGKSWRSVRSNPGSHWWGAPGEASTSRSVRRREVPQGDEQFRPEIDGSARRRTVPAGDEQIRPSTSRRRTVPHGDEQLLSRTYWRWFVSDEPVQETRLINLRECTSGSEIPYLEKFMKVSDGDKVVETRLLGQGWLF